MLYLILYLMHLKRIFASNLRLLVMPCHSHPITDSSTLHHDRCPGGTLVVGCAGVKSALTSETLVGYYIFLLNYPSLFL